MPSIDQGLQVQRAVLLAAATGDESWSPEESLTELSRLAETAGIEVVETVIQRLHTPQPRSYLGKGRLSQLRERKTELAFNAVIADDELTPQQQRFLESVLECTVIDRTGLILSIFSMHAHTREGRLQVELAQYRYRLPRLAGRGVELSRLGGGRRSAGAAGAGIDVRGPGETKLETDRRRIRHRIAELNREIEVVRQQRSVHRQQRRVSGIPVVALSGYTNAGKSLLMNALTGATVESSDRLFATLDPTTRRLQLANGQDILLTDTVGFIQKLPSDLVAAFRATIEEILEADLILHVVDASHPQCDEQAESVEDELEALGVASKPRLTVLNKIDLVPPERLAARLHHFGSPVCVSALTGAGLAMLQVAIGDRLSREFVPVQVEIPYSEAQLVGLFRTRGMVTEEVHRDRGTMITGRLPASLLPSFRQFLA